MKKFNFIYKTINLINLKIYVGAHSTNKLEDGYIGHGILKFTKKFNGTSFHKAVKEFGYENFKREIIEFCDYDQLKEREIYWQTQLDCTNPDIGYNAKIQGYLYFEEGFSHSVESRLNYSKSKMGENNPMFGKFGVEHPTYGIDRSGENNVMFGVHKYGEDSPAWGCTHSKESIEQGKKTFKENYKKDNHPFFGKEGPFSGHIHKESTIQIISSKAILRSQEKVKCPHCDKEGNIINMRRWHFNNCKNKIII